MGTLEMIEKIRAYKEWKQIQNEAEAQAKALSKEIIAELKAQGITKTNVDVFTISIVVNPNPRFNKESFLQDYGQETYEQYVVRNPFERLNVR